MSKPEAQDESGLGEILASIRKSLAEPVQPVEERKEELGDKLAAPIDDGADKAEAAVHASDAAAAAAGKLPDDGVGAPAGERAAAAGGEPRRRDPLWFLRAAREHEEAASDPTMAQAASPAAGDDAPAGLHAEEPTLEPGPQGGDVDRAAAATTTPTRGAEAGKDAPQAGAEAPVAIRLTQPHDLRKSFPPLFGEAPPVPAPMPIAAQADIPATAVTAFIERIKTPFFETGVSAVAAPEAGEGLAALETAPQTHAASGPSLAAMREPAALDRFTPLREGTPEPPVPERDVVLAAVSLESPQGPSEGQSLQSAAAIAAREPERAAAPLRAGEPVRHANGAAAAGVAPLPATAGLEAIIAELLEPVLRQWLETRLPGLIETAIREEVARQLRKPGAGDTTS
jgi:cell pole-organizing protein PopZ